ncbi:hypothetical protein V1514DRAFT_322208 [Lipomyces japonicus]|uniref:uncharacterized protein n=1 Tax=Lipomyces japonicus TaxID=56871 RepID=UPI0034CEAEED
MLTFRPVEYYRGLTRPPSATIGHLRRSVPSFATIESYLAIAGAAVSVATTLTNFYNDRRKRFKPPQREPLDMAKVKAYYFMRASQMIRIPTNLEIPPHLRNSSATTTNTSTGSDTLLEAQPVPDQPATQHLANHLEQQQQRRRHFRFKDRLTEYRKKMHKKFSFFKKKPKKQRVKAAKKQALQWWQRKHVYNILSPSDAILYTVEKVTRGTYIIFSYPDRRPQATIELTRWDKPFGRARRYSVIQFHVGNLSIRKVRRKHTPFDWYNVFYTADGAPYHWAKKTRKLERVINYGGKNEEIRQTVAQVRPLRRGCHEWELLINEEKVSAIAALATAFIGIKQQWDSREAPVVQSRTELRRS